MAQIRGRRRQLKIGQTSTLGHVHSDQPTVWLPPEQIALEESLGWLTDEEDKEVPLRFCKRTRGTKQEVEEVKEAGDLKSENPSKPMTPRVSPVSPVQATSPGGGGGNVPASSRLYPDNVSILNCDVYPEADEVLKKLFPTDDSLILEDKSLEFLQRRASTRCLQSIILVSEMDRRMSDTCHSLALVRENELKLRAELEASKVKVAEQEAKLVEYESTIRHLHTLLETVCSSQQAALACVDKQVKAAKAKIEAVDAQLAAKAAKAKIEPM